jgi:hypothetical protein
MIQSVKPFISSSDISKGDAWNDVLTTELKDAEYGIICITPYNVYKPWLIFEAGAMAHFMGRPKVTPLLFEVSPDALAKGPLEQFQSTELKRDDCLRLVATINRALPAASRVEEEVLDHNFRHWWKRLEEDLGEITRGQDETRTPYGWLRTFDDLEIHKQLCGCHAVWFVTSDVFNYAIRSDVQEKLVTNLGRAEPGLVSYRYLFPDRPDLRQRFESDLIELRRTHSGFDFRWVASKNFTEQAPSDCVMIEPVVGQALKVYVRAPIVEGNEDKNEYWFDAKPEAADGFFKRFSRLWAEAAPAGFGAAVSGREMPSSV